MKIEHLKEKANLGEFCLIEEVERQVKNNAKLELKERIQSKLEWKGFKRESLNSQSSDLLKLIIEVINEY
jgi:hypothetical protein